MNVSYRWLLELAPTIQESPEGVAERLGMLGAPVDELAALGAGIGDILIARVEEVRPHPNADRLRLCTVDAGNGAIQVVCGAPNVVAGRHYPFAPVGSALPGIGTIRRAKIRGEVSEGMLCSPRELGLGRDHAGLLTLSDEWRPGASFLESLQLDDTRLVLDVTANRPDLLSHLGVARELAPGGAADVRLTPFSSAEAPLEVVSGGAEVASEAIRVTIEDPSDCPRYLAAVVEGVRVAPSPDWLAARLRAVGVRPINNVVDATNYVLYELGQPLHAFDLDLLRGAEIRVRRAVAGESIKTLDGVTRLLDANAILIADRDRGIALAGIMGGEETEVSESTTRLLLECALFDPKLVRKTARALGLSTDASHRFERGVDVEEQVRAMRRVVDLIGEVSGGRLVGAILDAHPAPAQRTRIDLRPNRVKQVLGVEIGPNRVRELLAPIGFSIGDPDGAVEVVTPPYRPDVTREIDVIEEIARRFGYDNFDARLSYFRPGTVPGDPLRVAERAVHQLFDRWGFREARTAAFAPSAPERVPLLNPLSSEESHLRNDLVTGLLRRIEHNWAHGVRSVRLYEIGSVFSPGPGTVPIEEVHLAAAFTGPRRPPHWSEPTAQWDEWDLKGLLQELGDLLSAQPSVATETSRFPFGAETFDLTTDDGQVLGRAGNVRAGVLDAPAWAEPVYAVEVRLRPRPDSGPVTYRPLPVFPVVERDLALLLPAGVDAALVETAIRRVGGELLEGVWPFDLYEGQGIPEDTRSIAWRLRFRHAERTLTDAEVESIVASIVRALEEEAGVHRR
jgi:phenylalanyl-tRNA synthetase beta chain